MIAVPPFNVFLNVFYMNHCFLLPDWFHVCGDLSYFKDSIEIFHRCAPQLKSLDKGRKSNVQKTFRRLQGRLLNILCAFNLRPVSRGKSLRSLRSLRKPRAANKHWLVNIFRVHYVKSVRIRSYSGPHFPVFSAE